MKTLLRVLVQLILICPVLGLAPWAVIMGIGTIYLTITGEIDSFSKLFGYGFGWLGLAGLIGSIVLPIKKIKNSQVLRNAIHILIICGFIATGAIVSENSDPIGNISRLDWFGVWLLGGPIVVGLWNLVRILREVAEQVVGGNPLIGARLRQ